MGHRIVNGLAAIALVALSTSTVAVASDGSRDVRQQLTGRGGLGRASLDGLEDYGADGPLELLLMCRPHGVSYAK